MSGDPFGSADRNLLRELLLLPTVNPLESSEPPARMWQAQRTYARAAESIGFDIAHHAPPEPAVLERDDVPRTVRDVATADFLAEQPNLVLRLGPELPPERTVMFNAHLDTVAGVEPVSCAGDRITGRGAIDAKGPAVALLAGIRAAVAANPALGRDVGVLVQIVSGEEGGAMGTYGTRPLVEAGFFGRLNVFCEPTGLRYLTRATASMTARIRVDGHGAIDDEPAAGHNASVLLGFLAQHLARHLDPRDRPGRCCVAGLHTGAQHNRVYGSGSLLLNLSYATAREGAEAERALLAAVRSGVREFAEIFDRTREFARTAAHAAEILRVDWLKRGLPCLDAAPTWAQDLFAAAGIKRWPDTLPAFTCDAIWMHGIPDTATAVLGPGSLETNHAHAEGEYADVAELRDFARAVTSLLTEFTERHHDGARKETT
ncbi:M20 family metallopeptidase [Saccharopolyspora gloriosae]|uniref:M20 family metallopeptidase n=1 Tax=Saccharopolyspora gloriosae TaxID=455344 RepID=UPI001FB5DE15|nr:M20/M25/M40 family metallo-hydrolase [Saccharopolyspora gloriosae]